MFAIFTLIGGNIVIIAAGKATSPRKDLPQVIRFIYLTPIGCYVFAAFLVGFNINYTEPDLFHPWANSLYNPDISHSPFIIILKYTSIKVLPTFFNECFVFSAYTAALMSLSPTKSCLVSTKTNGLSIRIPLFILLVELCSPLPKCIITISLTKPLAGRIMEIHL
jgi:amino acid permease